MGKHNIISSDICVPPTTLSAIIRSLQQSIVMVDAQIVESIKANQVDSAMMDAEMKKHMLVMLEEFETTSACKED